MSGKGRWIRYGIASALIHGAVLSVYVPMNAPAPRRVDPIEVFVLDGSSSPSLLDQGGGGAKAAGRPHRGGPGPRVKEQLSIRPRAPVGGPPEHKANPLPPVPESAARNEVVASTRSFAPPGPEDGVATGVRGTSGPGGTGASGSGGLAGGTGNGTGTGGGSGQGEGGGAGFGTPGGPRFLHREVPEYPLLARRRGKEGTVVLMVMIDAAGRLSKVNVVETSDKLFVEPSVQAVKRSTFLPARRNGQPVTSAAILPVRFSLREDRSEP
ncbi:MAG: energy transducer TonB [Syntrophorhabdales bacterium]